VRHLSVDSYVYRPLAEGHTTSVQHSLIELRSALSEVPETQPGNFTFIGVLSVEYWDASHKPRLRDVEKEPTETHDTTDNK